MGFNRHVAWAHTFSRGHRFTVYKLDLVPGDPTAYRYGDEQRAMSSRALTVEVADGEGGVHPLTRTLWSTHYGPMLNLPMLGWSDFFAFTYRDANLDNDRFLRQVVAMDTATGMDDFQDAYRIQGMPWVNTLAADDAGRAWYIDAGMTPNLTPEADARFVEAVRTDPITQLAFGLRVALLDGSDPAFEWQDDPDAPSPGVLSYERLPKVERDDHVFNANDPYWLPHAEVQLPAHPSLCGLHHDRVSARTRMNALLVQGDGFTPEGVVDAVLGNQSLFAELLGDDLIERLRGLGTVEAEGRTVDGPALAAILEAWDRRFDLDSRGAVLFRELLASFPEEARTDGGPLWAEPYDPADPVATPRGLAPAPEAGPDPLAVAAAQALAALEAAGLAPDVRLGDAQFVERGGRRWPLHGGFEVEGIANVIAPLGTLARADLQPGPDLPAPIPGRTERTGLHQGGYPAVYGVSYLQVVSFTDDGPDARGLLVYGQSGDPDSPRHVDQLEDFAAKRLRPLRFTDEAIAADPAATSRTLRA
jgi:acyl-homoserine-lactone acylase